MNVAVLVRHPCLNLNPILPQVKSSNISEAYFPQPFILPINMSQPRTREANNFQLADQDQGYISHLSMQCIHQVFYSLTQKESFLS